MNLHKLREDLQAAGKLNAFLETDTLRVCRVYQVTVRGISIPQIYCTFKPTSEEILGMLPELEIRDGESWFIVRESPLYTKWLLPERETPDV